MTQNLMANSSPNRPNQPAAGGSNKRAEWAAWLVISLAIAAVVILIVTTMTPSSGRDAGLPREGQAQQQNDRFVVPTGEVVELDVEVEGMAFVPNSVEIAAGDSLKITFTNTGDQVHDLKIGNDETGRVNPGNTAVLETAPLGESIQGYCTIVGHHSQGMVFDVTVTGTATGTATGNAAGNAAGEHNHEAVAGDNPHVTVPSMAELGTQREGFKAFDASLKPALSTTVHEYTWVATEEKREVAPGIEQVQWLFNGQAPGPTLRGTIGDTFRITLRNEGTMGHSLDFHAGEISPDQAMATIQPGEEVVYEFTARRAGIWMYHCATMPMSLHIANGMAGAVIIDPPADSELALADVDAEYAMIASEIFLGESEVGADPKRVANGEFDLMAFNYYPSQYALEPLQAKVGDTILMWIMNVGPDEPLSFHVVGEVFDTVFTEGAYTVRDTAETGSQALSLLPAQGGFVEMTFDEPGTYTFVNHVMTRAEKGQSGSIVVVK